MSDHFGSPVSDGLVWVPATFTGTIALVDDATPPLPPPQAGHDTLPGLFSADLDLTFELLLELGFVPVDPTHPAHGNYLDALEAQHRAPPAEPFRPSVPDSPDTLVVPFSARIPFTPDHHLRYGLVPPGPASRPGPTDDGAPDPSPRQRRRAGGLRALQQIAASPPWLRNARPSPLDAASAPLSGMDARLAPLFGTPAPDTETADPMFASFLSRHSQTPNTASAAGPDVIHAALAIPSRQAARDLSALRHGVDHPDQVLDRPNKLLLAGGGEEEGRDPAEDLAEGQQALDDFAYRDAYKALEAIDPSNPLLGPFYRPQGWHATEQNVREIETMLDVVRMRQNEDVCAMFDGDPRAVPRADSVADKERYLTLLRSQMEKPYVVDLDLAHLIRDVYRDGSEVGNGSSAAAVREENTFEVPVKGKWHTIKSKNMVVAFEHWLNTHPNARQGDGLLLRTL